MYLTCVPAYGRDYKNQNEVKAAWVAGKDFMIQDMFKSGYVNINDCPKDAKLNIRFKKLASVCVIDTSKPVKVKAVK